MSYRFYPVAAIDPHTGQPIVGRSGQLFSADDVRFAKPVRVRIDSGATVSEIVADEGGLFPGFECALPFVFWVSGPVRIPINSAHPVSIGSGVQKRGRRWKVARRALLIGGGAVAVAAIARVASDPPDDVVGDLQSLVDAQPRGGTIALPVPENGKPYYLHDQLNIPTGVTLQGAAPLRNLRSKWDGGGVVLAPAPGVTFPPGKAVVACSGSRAQLKDVSVIAGTRADYAVRDTSTDSVHSHLATYGGSICSYEGSAAQRIRLEVPSIKGLGVPGSVALRLGQDSQMIGGTKNAGTMVLANNQGQVTGAHLTGGAPNVEVSATRCQLTGCVIDASSGVSMIKVDRGARYFNATGLQFYQGADPMGGQVPAILIAGQSDGVFTSCTLQSTVRVPKLPFFIEFGHNDPGGWSLVSIDAGASVEQLWDRQPGSFVAVRSPDGVWRSER